MSTTNTPMQGQQPSGPVISRLKRWGAMRYPWPLWLIPVVLISPAAFLIPVDVFVQYPWVQTYAYWLAKVIPMIDRAAHLHPHPEQFKAFFAHAWSVLPLITLVVWISAGYAIRQHIAQVYEEKKGSALGILAMSVWCLGIVVVAPVGPFGGWGLIDRHDMRYLLYSSDWALFWSGPFQIFFIAGILLVIFCIGGQIRAEVYSVKTPGQEG